MYCAHIDKVGIELYNEVFVRYETCLMKSSHWEGIDSRYLAFHKETIEEIAGYGQIATWTL